MNIKKLSNLKLQSSVRESFMAIALKKLNKNEKDALSFLSRRIIIKNATQTAKELKEYLKCAESTSWNTLRSLRALKLVEYNKNEGILKLSNSAKFLLEEEVC